MEARRLARRVMRPERHCLLRVTRRGSAPPLSGAEEASGRACRALDPGRDRLPQRVAREAARRAAWLRLSLQRLGRPAAR